MSARQDDGFFAKLIAILVMLMLLAFFGLVMSCTHHYYVPEFSKQQICDPLTNKP